MRKTTHSRLAIAILTGSMLAISACGADRPPAEDERQTTKKATVTYAGGQEYDSYNNTTAGANALKNSQINQLNFSGFWQFKEGGQVQPNTEFGTYEKTSDDPLTVEYKINDKAVWSDGQPVDCDDVLLWWAQQSGKYDFSVVDSSGIEDTKMPDCEPGGREFTLEYEKPYADWDSNGPGHGNTAMMPAHVVADQGGLSPEELVAAIKDGDNKKLKKAAKFFNEGWLFQGELPDEKLIPSSGPYKITAFEAGQSITLKANDKYWGTPPASDTFVARWIQEDEQAQALENGEVNVIEPQPNVDLKNQVDALQGVQSQTYDTFIYEHLDFNFDSSPFKDKALREAFAKCVPRQLIVDNLIKPITPDAEMINVRNVAPFEEGFDQVAAAAGGEQYNEPDVEGAKKLLEDAGKTGTEVKIGFISENPRRQQTAELIKDSCDKAGFDVKPSPSKKFFDTDGGLSQNTYDVALFAWVGSGLVSGWNSTFVSPKKCTADGKGNNNGCYSNAEVDRLSQQVIQETDKGRQREITAQIEKILWDDLATIPLFMHPGIGAWSDSIDKVIPNPAQSTITWNAYQWTVK